MTQVGEGMELAGGALTVIGLPEAGAVLAGAGGVAMSVGYEEQAVGTGLKNKD